MPINLEVREILLEGISFIYYGDMRVETPVMVNATVGLSPLMPCPNTEMIRPREAMPEMKCLNVPEICEVVE